MKRAARTLSGFTLIELLVVISIIALLIGILLPALGSARKTAQYMQAGANQRSIAQGMYIYATSDSNFRFPIWQWTNTSGGDVLGNQVNAMAGPENAIQGYWTTLLVKEGILQNLEMYEDPSWEANYDFLKYSLDTSLTPNSSSPSTGGGGRPGQSTGSNIGNMATRAYNRIHFGYNYIWVGAHIATHYSSSYSGREGAMTEPRPSDTPASPDDMMSTGDVLITATARNPSLSEEDGEEFGGHVLMDYPYPTTNATYPHARHNGGVQISWGDGHVSTTPVPGAVTDPKNYELPYSDEALGDIRQVKNYGDTGSSSGSGRPGGASAPTGQSVFDLWPQNPGD